MIDDDVYDDGDITSNETVVVESTASVTTVVAALTSAAERMMLVGEDGREDEKHELDADGFEVYTPNYVSAVISTKAVILASTSTARVRSSQRWPPDSVRSWSTNSCGMA